MSAKDFYDGVWAVINSTTWHNSRDDHIDMAIDILFEDAPDGATLKGLIDLINYADEGGVLDIVITPRVDKFQGESLRIIDMQAGADCSLPSKRHDELTAGCVSWRDVK